MLACFLHSPFGKYVPVTVQCFVPTVRLLPVQGRETVYSPSYCIGDILGEMSKYVGCQESQRRTVRASPALVCLRILRDLTNADFDLFTLFLNFI